MPQRLGVTCRQPYAVRLPVSIQLYDTLRRTKRVFEPREPDKVSMYVCGPTVYDVPHLGHGRTALTYDIIRRYLTWRGYEVTVVSNVTDIDDKIIARAAEVNSTESELAARYTAAYDDEMSRLGIIAPHSQPHATEAIDEMVTIIARLVDVGAAYVVPERGVYFAVDKVAGYGRLAGRSLDQLLADAGSRVDLDEAKRSPLDFALWKAAKPNEPTWPTPWGEGRPGWHTECVAMSMGALGAGFDIHGGGDDLVFPHHQNEWAQVEAMGEQFARYWVHSAMVNVAGKKMAKSEGNFTNLSDAIDHAGALALRMAVAQTHYRNTMEMSADALSAAGNAIGRLANFAERAGGSVEPAALDGYASYEVASAELSGAPAEVLAQFTEAMDDDFGTPTAVDVGFGAVRTANAAFESSGGVAGDVDGLVRVAATVFGTLGVSLGALRSDAATGDEVLVDGISVDDWLRRRRELREGGDYAAADGVRDQLAAAGVAIKDLPDGTSTWSVSSGASGRDA